MAATAGCGSSAREAAPAGGQRLDDAVTVAAEKEAPTGRVFAIGTHADQARGTVTFDRVDWFTGRAAVAACRADRKPITPTAWCNDFYYRNSEARQETVKVADGAKLTVADYDALGDTVPQIPATLTELDERFTSEPTVVILTIDRGTVVSLQEQFIP